MVNINENQEKYIIKMNIKDGQYKWEQRIIYNKEEYKGWSI